MARPARVDVLRSVRRFCLECQGESAPAVRQCTDRQCALWPWRLPSTPAAAEEAHADLPLTAEGEGAEPAAQAGASIGVSADASAEASVHASPEAAALRRKLARQALRAVRCHCMQCAGDRREVRACAAREDCTLWSLRFGVRPETYKAVRQRFFAPKKLSLF